VDANNKPLTRDEIIKEFVAQGLADSEEKAGRQLSVLSRILTISIGKGQKSKQTKLSNWGETFEGIKTRRKDVYRIKDEHFGRIRQLVAELRKNS